MSLTLSSSDFTPGAEIPRVCTCEGRDESPQLSWSGAPQATRSFALVVDDPDAPDPQAPKVRWVHWVLYDLPAECTELPRALKQLPHGARAGRTDFERTGFGGPCPPIGRHRYFFTLYALDVTLGDRGELTRHELEHAMAGHVLAKAQLMGTYQKQKA